MDTYGIVKLLLPPRQSRGNSQRIREKRVLLLSSHEEQAAYSAAYSLAFDESFGSCPRRVFSPATKKFDVKSDLDIIALAKDEVLGEEAQILLVDIDGSCGMFFDSILKLQLSAAGTIQARLRSHSSYLILAVDEKLVNGESAGAKPKGPFPLYAVSHLRYLLARDLADRAEDLEKRLLATVERGALPMDLRELYQRVAERLAEGGASFEEFLCELEQISSLPLAVRRERLQTINPWEIFREESEVHRVAAFVATHFPDLAQGDFDRLVLLLLGDETTLVERERQTIGSDGEMTTWREQVEERYSDRWRRDADRIFRDCRLRTAISGDGSWVVDFSEPYLRRELRGYLEQNFPWYVKRQCQALQDSGVVFSLDLSRVAVEGLVRLFVERAIVDPAGFGNVWLVELVLGLRIQVQGEPPSALPEESLAWLLERLTVEVHLRAHFQGRLALLIREMLDRESLLPMVGAFFEFLIAARKHDVLLDVVLDLARRLRFAPHFDPLVWMKRLLDQGSEAVRVRTAERMISLAIKSGPQIYEFLSVVKSWLPETGRSPERFSRSNCFALNFLFDYCREVTKSMPLERLGAWPSRHPLFYGLPSEPAEAREEIGDLVEWLLDPRGASLERADETEAMRTAEVVRIGHLADLLEHWAWALEGSTEDGPAEGRSLFGVVVKEIDRRIAVRERTWLQRSWQQRQDDYLRQATIGGSSGGPGRALLVARRAKLDQLRMRFAALASTHARETSETKRGSSVRLEVE